MKRLPLLNWAVCLLNHDGDLPNRRAALLPVQPAFTSACHAAHSSSQSTCLSAALVHRFFIHTT